MKKKYQIKWTVYTRTRILFLIHILCSTGYAFAQAQPLALHPENPHYFLFRGKPTALITSAEHYGAVLNRDFDYVTYLNALQADGLNLTRTFTGAYVEPEGAFKIEKNTLAPLPNRFICPWARSTTPGYANGGNKFDLNTWDEAYFTRLKDFVQQASKRGIVVEMNLFCPFYEDMQWKISPLNVVNNINSLGNVARTDVYTLDKNGGLLAVQEKMVRKIVEELKGFDNIYYEICNEPYFGGVTMEWQHHMASLIAEIEKDLPAPHLISLNIANGSKKILDPHPAVSVFNFHYAMPPYAVPQNYSLNKVIGDNETGFKGTSDSVYRKEAWEFILAGGGLFNHLDYSFTAGHEKGDFAYPATQPGGGGVSFRQQMKILKDFIHNLDFIRMRPDTAIVTNNIPGKPAIRALAEPGKQYALYIPGNGLTQLDMDIPAGKYKASWLNPVTGKFTKPEKLTHKGGKLSLPIPSPTQDMALLLSNRKIKPKKN